MLYKETISQTTLGLLTRMMKDKVLDNFILVGGTALSLQLGHRISIDIDLFCNKEDNVKGMKNDDCFIYLV